MSGEQQRRELLGRGRDDLELRRSHRVHGTQALILPCLGRTEKDEQRGRLQGISTEDAVNMIVNGFCKEVFRELPMEFAVEAQKLLGISLEGSVG